jgi:hypothetical protein
MVCVEYYHIPVVPLFYIPYALWKNISDGKLWEYITQKNTFNMFFLKYKNV